MEASTKPHLLIVVEESDIAKYFSRTLISAFESVVPKLDVGQIGLCHLDVAKKRYKSCQKLLFVTDESIAQIPFEKIHTWIQNIKGIKSDPRKILVVHFSNHSQSNNAFQTKNDSSLFVQANVKLEERVVLVNNIDALETWCPKTIQFLLQIKNSFRNIPELKFNPKNCSTDLAVADAVNECIVKFDGGIKSDGENSLPVGESVKTSPNVFDNTEKIETILHTLIEIHSTRVKREARCECSCKSCECETCSDWIGFLICIFTVLLNVPITCLFIAVSLCPLLGCATSNALDKNDKCFILTSGALVVVLFITSMVFGVWSYTETVNFVFVSTTYDLLIFSVIIPAYVLFWVLTLNCCLKFRDYKLGTFSIPGKVLKRIPVVDSIGHWLSDREIWYWSVHIIGFPFAIFILLLVFLSSFLGNKIWRAIGIKNFHVFTLFTNIHVQVSISVICIVLGVMCIDNVGIFWALCIAMPCYCSLVISPADYIARKYLYNDEGIFWLVSYMWPECLKCKLEGD